MNELGTGADNEDNYMCGSIKREQIMEKLERKQISELIIEFRLKNEDKFWFVYFHSELDMSIWNSSVRLGYPQYTFTYLIETIRKKRMFLVKCRGKVLTLKDMLAFIIYNKIVSNIANFTEFVDGDDFEVMQFCQLKYVLVPLTFYNVHRKYLQMLSVGSIVDILNIQNGKSHAVLISSLGNVVMQMMNYCYDFIDLARYDRSDRMRY